MKKLCLFLLFIASACGFAQNMGLFDIDVSAFPTVRAKFYAIDIDGKQVLPSVSDLSLTEDGLARTITNVSCPAVKPIPPISTVLVMDASASMSGSGLAFAKTAAKVWIYGSPCILNVENELKRYWL